jgi:thiamine monophosphate synthase
LALAGADAIAVIGSLFMAPDIEAAARVLSQPFSSPI